MKDQAILKDDKEEIKYRRVSTGRLALATTSALSLACFTSAIGYVSYAANTGFGISTVLIGTLMTIARLFDGITDPLISILIDKINTKFGKIRLFMVLGWIIESVSLLGLYNWFSNKGHSVILFSVIYLVYYIGYTLQNMATQLISPVITNDPTQRPKVGVFNIIYNYLIATILNLVVTVILLPQNGNQYNPSLLATISVITVILSGIFLVLSCIGVSSVDKTENFIVSHRNDKGLGWKDIFAFLKKNRALQCFVFSATSDKLATNISGQAIIGTILYGVIIGNMVLGAILNMISIIPSLVSAAVGGKYVGKHGSAKAISFWSFVSIVVNILLIVILLISGKTPIRNNITILVLFVILVMLQNGLRVIVSTATSSMLADVVDYEAYRSGNYMPGTVAGVYSFVDKFVSSLGAVIATVSIAMIGYKETVPQPTDEKTMAIVILGCVIVYLIPIFGWVISMIAMRKTPISKNMMIEVQKKISENKICSNIESEKYKKVDYRSV